MNREHFCNVPQKLKFTTIKKKQVIECKSIRGPSTSGLSNHDTYSQSTSWFSSYDNRKGNKYCSPKHLSPKSGKVWKKYLKLSFVLRKRNRWCAGTSGAGGGGAGVQNCLLVHELPYNLIHCPRNHLTTFQMDLASSSTVLSTLHTLTRAE